MRNRRRTQQVARLQRHQYQLLLFHSPQRRLHRPPTRGPMCHPNHP